MAYLINDIAAAFELDLAGAVEVVEADEIHLTRNYFSGAGLAVEYSELEISYPINDSYSAADLTPFGIAY